MGHLFLGIDIGTGESKGVLVNERLEVISTKSTPHEVSNPRPGWFEMNAEKDWWGDFCNICHAFIDKGIAKAEDIGCIGLSALGCDCVAVDANGNAMAPAILYGIDSRSTAEIEELSTSYGKDAETTFGHAICSSDIAPKILWLRHNMPDIWEKADKFLTGSSYLCAKLTGKHLIDAYLAEDFLPLYDLGTRTVNVDGCERFCRPDQLADIANATDVAGGVTAEAARETGLLEGTPVIVGTGDSSAEAISTGVLEPGDLMIQMGSTCYFVCLTDHLVKDPRLWPGTFIIPGTFSVCAGTNTAGALTKWIRDEFYRDALTNELAGGRNAYAVMADDAASVEPGSDGLVCLPYLAGERTPVNDPDARGVFFGLSSTHTRAHMTRAAIEGIACTISQNVEAMEADGIRIHKVMCVGGGTKNEAWLQCTADMLERPVATAGVTIGAAFGDAIMASFAGGAYKSWADLSKHVQQSRIIEPRPEFYPRYRELRKTFAQLYAVTKDLMHLTIHSKSKSTGPKE